MTHTHKTEEIKMASKYLGEILRDRSYKMGSNNMILSPAGSGKTYYIYNVLASEYSGLKLMLVSTTTLKQSLQVESASFTTEDLRKRRVELGISDEDVYVMTYAEFGKRVSWDVQDKFINQFSVIFADEIHSLFNYYSFSGSGKTSLGIAMVKLFSKHENIDKYYFTATTEKMDKFREINGDDLFAELTTVNLLEDKEIKRNRAAMKVEFSNTSDILDIIDTLEDFKEMGNKGVIYNPRIKGMKKIEASLERKGFKCMSLWSPNNKKNPMSEEQLEVQRMLLEENKIREDIDFIIINASMREGWDLKDLSVDFMLANTTDETDVVQFLGRLRRDIRFVAVRVDKGLTPVDERVRRRISRNPFIIEDVLGEKLYTEDKEELSKEIEVVRDNGSLVRWGVISRVLEMMGYEIEEGRERVEGKHKRYSVITKVEEEDKVSREIEEVSSEYVISPEELSSRFITGLKMSGFERENRENLVNYMEGKGIAVAYNHIKASYVEYVTGRGWSERKFADATYLIASKGNGYTKANYEVVEKEMLNDIRAIEEERKKYSIKREYERKREEGNEEAELLAYIAANMS